MTACVVCHGAGVVYGAWRPEQCPACGGVGHVKLESDEPPDSEMSDGMFVACVGLGLVIGTAILWQLVAFLWSVL